MERKVKNPGQVGQQGQAGQQVGHHHGGHRVRMVFTGTLCQVMVILLRIRAVLGRPWLDPVTGQRNSLQPYSK